MTPTPDQIKTAARNIRVLEQDRLGDQLANTTVLNALTRAFGLGDSFSAYASAQKAAAQPDTPILVTASIFVPNTDAETHTITDIGLDDLMIADLADTYTIDFCPAAHGFEEILIFRIATDGSPTTLRRELADAISPLIDALNKAVRDEALFGPVRHFISADSDRLHVNFRYHNNDQVCTANVPRDAWIARESLGLSDEAAMLLMATDIEISPHYDAGDITVEDVFEDMVFHTES